jgi:hypothetical protein
MVNHTITDDFEIKAGKNREITRKTSKFTLNNKKLKIELRYPDGKVAQKIKYDKKDGTISEGELYEKGKGGWSWKNAKQNTITKLQDTNKIQNTIDNNQTVNENIGEDEAEDVVKKDIEMSLKEKEIPILLAQNDKYLGKIILAENEPCVLGAETIRETGNEYFFTPELPEQKHYLIVFTENLFLILNLKINMLINYFSV